MFVPYHQRLFHHEGMIRLDSPQATDTEVSEITYPLQIGGLKTRAPFDFFAYFAPFAVNSPVPNLLWLRLCRASPWGESPQGGD